MPARDTLCIQPQTGEHVSLGSLHFGLLADYRGPGLEWRRFLTICADNNGEDLYMFDVGRAGQLFYVRAYTEREAEQGWVRLS
jgi:hypothetical protein